MQWGLLRRYDMPAGDDCRHVRLDRGNVHRVRVSPRSRGRLLRRRDYGRRRLYVHAEHGAPDVSLVMPRRTEPCHRTPRSPREKRRPSSSTNPRDPPRQGRAPCARTVLRGPVRPSPRPPQQARARLSSSPRYSPPPPTPRGARRRASVRLPCDAESRRPQRDKTALLPSRYEPMSAWRRVPDPPVEATPSASG
jgi:hypothetical protein